MRRIFTTLLISTISINTSAQKEFANRYWFGILEGASLPLNLHFESRNDSVFPMLYSPMQGVEKIVPSSFRITADSLFINVKNLNFEGKWVYNRVDSTFSGQIKQYGNKLNIKLKPSDGIFEIRRPQTPEKPFPYIEEEVQIENTADNATLSGTLTYPKKGKALTTVILISGSGAQNRDEEIFKHKPFMVIANYLTRQGMAVLRCDDRGFGKSSGDINSTTLDFANDVETMLGFLQSHPKTKGSKIGLVGHSEGGLIAPIVASRNKEVAFIILLAGPGVDGKETLLLQNKKICQIGGMADSLINKRLKILEEIFELSVGGEDKDMLLKINEIVKKHTVNKQERKALGLSPKEVLIMNSQLQNRWMRTFLRLDPCTYLRSVECPILALNGEKDCQVLPMENTTAISKCTNGKAETIIVPNLNHLFQNCTTGSVEEYMTIEETFSEKVLELITKWIKKKVE